MLRLNQNFSAHFLRAVKIYIAFSQLPASLRAVSFRSDESKWRLLSTEEIKVAIHNHEVNPCSRTKAFGGQIAEVLVSLE